MCRILNPISFYVQDTESYAEEEREQANSLYTSEQEGKRKHFYFVKYSDSTVLYCTVLYCTVLGFQNTSSHNLFELHGAFIIFIYLSHLFYLIHYYVIAKTSVGRKLVFQNQKIGLENFFDQLFVMSGPTQSLVHLFLRS